MTTEDLLSLYLEYYPNFYKAAFAYLRNPHDTEDVLQQTIIKALPIAAQFQPGGYPGLLHRMVVNQAIELKRRQNTKRRYLPTDWHIDDIYPPSRPPLDASRIEWIRRQYRHFNPQQQKILDLVIEGLSNPEIAARLGINLSTVKSTITRSIARLKRLREEQHVME